MFPGRRLHGIWVGERLSSVFSNEVSNLVCLCFGFFLWSRIYSLRLVFPRHRLSMVVADFFRSSSFQPRPCQFFTLGGWPTCAREVTPWTGACGSRLVFQGACSTRVVAPLDAGPNFGFCLGRFMFYFFSQSASVMLKCYWTIY